MICDVVVRRGEPQLVCGAEKRAGDAFCYSHWMALPKALRDEVWRTFRAGQGSAAHIAALTECYVFLSAPIPEGAG